jgi:hypothetical protein
MEAKARLLLARIEHGAPPARSNWNPCAMIQSNAPHSPSMIPSSQL